MKNIIVVCFLLLGCSNVHDDYDVLDAYLSGSIDIVTCIEKEFDNRINCFIDKEKEFIKQYNLDIDIDLDKYKEEYKDGSDSELRFGENSTSDI